MISNPFLDWYRQHGVRRGNDPADPDNNLRKISIGGWLDPVSRMYEKATTLKNKIKESKRACIAVWGPSQTGKSTLLSHYVDGEVPDGSDSAMTWDRLHPVRFSPPLNGEVPAGTLVFNPFHFGSDASGVATRYVMVGDEDESTVDVAHPVEIRLASMGQVIQSLSLGYISECDPEDEVVNFTREIFLNSLPGADSASSIDMGVYGEFKTVADAIECMRNQDRFANLFRNGEWERTIRPRLVSAAVHMTGDEVRNFIGGVFWDSSARMSELYGKLADLRKKLVEKWGDRKVVASYEVAALLLDIDSFRSFLVVSPDNKVSAEIHDKVSKLTWAINGDIVELSISDRENTPSTELSIAGNNFGYFQALCGELIVPMREKPLQQNPEFAKLCSQCDILDLPGLSNKNAGPGVATQGVKINLKNASDADLLTRALKEGKTQCFVYGYIRDYGIDAFLILVRSGRYPSKTNLLDAGVVEWIKSYNREWKCGEDPGVPVFLNLTFFAKTLNDIAANGGCPDLQPVAQMVKTTLTFAARESSFWLATTYPQFPDGCIQKPEAKDRVVGQILENSAFIGATGFTREQLQAVYGADGGVDYMLRTVRERLVDNAEHRRMCCQKVFGKTLEELERLVKKHLPSADDDNAAELKRELAAVSDKIEAALCKVEHEESDLTYLDIANEIKLVFSASHDIFDPIPANAGSQSDRVINDYVKNQVAKWFNWHLGVTDDAGVLTKADEEAILRALRGTFRTGSGGMMDTHSLASFIRNRLSTLDTPDVRMAGRFPFAVAFGNMLRCGSWVCKSDLEIGNGNPAVLDDLVRAEIEHDPARTSSPYYVSLIAPLQKRIVDLQGIASCGKRPPQDGDEELGKIAKDIAGMR